ncbi:MAG: EamA family transporter [Rhodobacteraceae bacterium]|nr:EamA family transporter [Paracoccaceae bacterium]
MSFGVFLAVLFAAFLHAGWNALIKMGADKLGGMVMLSVAHGVLALPLALISPWPSAETWPWLIGSGLIHFAYQVFLMLAYQHGDLSRVYPIARGTAPMLVLIVSMLALSDAITAPEVAGILVLGGGIALMARGVLTNGESRRMLPYAFGAALATAGYTLTDGLGARASGEPVAYVGWLMIASALFYAPAAVALKGRAVLRASPRAWGLGMIAAAASFGAYAIAVWAMTRAPIALVGALRETSILFAVLIGWVFFRERLDRGKLIAAALIVAGVMLTRL